MLSEAETRKRLVEKALKSAGWLPIVDYVRGGSLMSLVLFVNMKLIADQQTTFCLWMEWLLQLLSLSGWSWPPQNV